MHIYAASLMIGSMRPFLRQGLECVGLCCMLWMLYSLAYSMRQAYSLQAQKQEKHEWLYRHCLENEKLRELSGACDEVLLLFAVSPWEAAFKQSCSFDVQQLYALASEWQNSVSELILQHRLVFWGGWVLLFVSLPRFFLPKKKDFFREKQRLVQRAEQSVSSVLRFRPQAHKMCLV